MNPLYIYFIIFFCIGYLVYTDPSIAVLADFLFKKVRFEYEKNKWWLLNNPKMPWAKFIIWRRALRNAKDLAKELQK